jgi:hypothetical protein
MEGLGSIRFGNPGEEEDFLRRHSEFVARFQNIELAIETAFTRALSEESRERVILFLLGRSCCEELMEILLLCAQGYGIGAHKVLRGMYENAVTARHLAAHPEDTSSFMEFHHVQKHKLLGAIERSFGTDVIPSVEAAAAKEAFEAVKERFFVVDCKTCGTKRLSYSWTKVDFVTMASRVPTLADLIVQAYYEPTKHTHSSIGALLARLDTSGDAVVPKGAPQRELADDALLAAHRVILDVLRLHMEQFAVPSLVAIVEACEQDFVEIWKPKTGPSD